MDVLLDDPRVANALLTGRGVKTPPSVVFYVLVRQVMLEHGVDDRAAADYVASVLVRFGQARRAFRLSDDDPTEYHYVTEIVERLDRGGERERFMARVHLGDFALWLTGLFPGFLDARVRRRGAPPVSYFEQWGSTGYRLAAESPEAERVGIEQVLRAISQRFGDVRVALNRLSDRHFWPGSGGDPIARLLREVGGR